VSGTVTVTEPVADRRRLRQASVLARLREALAETRAGLEARHQGLEMSLTDLEAQLARLEQEEGGYRARVERVCSHVVILHHGKVVADDSIERLRTLMALPTLESIFS